MWGVILIVAAVAAMETLEQKEEIVAPSDLSNDDECHGAEPGECALNALQRRGLFAKSAPPAGEGCHTAVPGETCYEEVQWGKTQGIFQHPEWYTGLNETSSDADFQQVVHRDQPTKCPVPCGADGAPLAPLPPVEKPAAPAAPAAPGVPAAPAAPVAPAGELPGAAEEAAAAQGKWCASGSAPVLWKPSPAGPGMEVKVLSYNLFWWNLFRMHGGNHDSAGRLIKGSMGDQPYDFMGFQECEGPARVLAGVGLLETYGIFQGGHAVCMAYNKKAWTVLAQGTDEVAEDMPQRWYGKRGAQWMRLKHLVNGRTALFVNHHGPLSVNSGGLCGGRATANNLLQLMARRGAPGDLIILVGDFNANAGSSTIQSLWPHLLHVYNGDSWGGVDNVFSNIGSGSIVSAKTLGDGGSDHHAISAVVSVGSGGVAAASGPEPGKSVQDLIANPPGQSWQTFWCGKQEPDIEYVFPEGAQTWAAPDGRAPDWCCRECQADAHCKAWRWVKGASPLCLFSAVMPIKKVAKPSHVDVVSGLPASTAAAEATANSRLAIRG